MRVTESQIYDAAAMRIAKARDDHARASDQVSSGKRIEHVWDGSGDAGVMTRHEQEAARQTAIMTATEKASDELGAVDTALGQIIDSLSRARELATQMANDTYGAADRANAAAEIQSIYESTVARMNTRFGDRYVFGGSRDTTPPFDAAGVYQGDTLIRQVEVAPGILQSAAIRGDQAFKGVGGGLDVLGQLQALTTALNANDVTAVRASVDSMANSVTQVTSFRSRAGGLMNVFDVATNTARVNRDLASDSKAKLENVDVFESATTFAAAERALEATLTATSKSFQPTLLNKL